MLGGDVGAALLVEFERLPSGASPRFSPTFLTYSSRSLGVFSLRTSSGSSSSLTFFRSTFFSRIASTRSPACRGRCGAFGAACRRPPCPRSRPGPPRRGAASPLTASLAFSAPRRSAAAAVGQGRVGQLAVDLGEPGVERRGDGDDAAVLRDGGEAALGLDGDVLPDLGAVRVGAALDGVDDDVLLDRLLARLGVLHVVRVVHVRRRVADQEDDLQRLLVVGPLDLVDRVVAAPG